MTMLVARVNGVPVPRTSAEAAPYWAGTRLGELRFQRCGTCGAANFGPGVACRACRGRDLAWVAGTGCGRVYSWTVVWRPQTPAFEVPYAPAIVRLDEGYDLLAALVDIDHLDIVEGLRVRVQFHALDDAITLPFFAPDQRD